MQILVDRLRVLHGISAVLHLANGVLGTLVAAGGDVRAGIAKQRVLYGGAGRLKCESSLPASASRTCVASYSPFAGLVASEFITFAWQIAYIVELSYVTSTGGGFLNTGVHWLRWWEYSVTATIISLSSLIGVGLRDAASLCFAVVGLVVMQLLGGFMERLRNKDVFAARALFFLASAPQVAVFVVVGWYAYGGGDEAQGDGASRAGDLWQQTVAVYTLSYLSFPAVAAARLFSNRFSVGQAEAAYSFSSVTVKTVLFWLIVSTVREASEDEGYYARSGIVWAAVRYSAITLGAVSLTGVAAFIIAAIA